MGTHYERLKPYIPPVTEMEMETRPEQEQIVPEDEERERQPTEDIEPEDDISIHGTFDAETNSELSFTAPLPNQVEASDRVLRPRTRGDYCKVENPDEIELFSNIGASRMEEDDNSVVTRMTMKLAALKHEFDYDSKKKVTKWLVDQCRPGTLRGQSMAILFGAKMH